MTKVTTQNITSYDLLKTFAVITMIIDHIGYYFFPEVLEWRVIGRLSMPVWMFLIGYANTREIPKELWVGGLVLVGANIVVGMPILALNILFGIMLVRLTLDKLMEFLLPNPVYIALFFIFMVFCFFPTDAIIEYGTMCYLFAMLGYVVRHNKFSDNTLTVFIMVITLAYLVFQKLIMGMDQTQFLIMATLVTAEVWLIQYFRSEEYADITKQLPDFLSEAIRFTGRNTLEIYVMHLLMFKILALFIMADRYQFLDFKLF